MTTTSQDLEAVNETLREEIRGYRVAITNLKQTHATEQKESNNAQRKKADRYAALQAVSESYLLEAQTLKSTLSQSKQRYKDAELAVEKLEARIGNRSGSAGSGMGTLSPEERRGFRQVLEDCLAIADKYENHIQKLQRQLEASERQDPADESGRHKHLREELEKEKADCAEHRFRLNAVISQERSQKSSLQKKVEALEAVKKALLEKVDSQDANGRIARLKAQITKLQSRHEGESFQNANRIRELKQMNLELRQEKGHKPESGTQAGLAARMRDLDSRLTTQEAANQDLQNANEELQRGIDDAEQRALDLQAFIEGNGLLVPSSPSSSGSSSSHTISNHSNSSQRVTRSQHAGNAPPPPPADGFAPIEFGNDDENSGENEEVAALRRREAELNADLENLRALLARTLMANLPAPPPAPRPRGPPRKRKAGLGREALLIREGERFVKEWPHEKRACRRPGF